MITDGLANIARYRGLSRGLDVLIDWLAENDPTTLPTGRNEILGSKVFANVQETATRAVEDAHFEVHHRYMDVHLDLEGYEDFKATPGETVPFGPFDEAGDGGLCDPAPGNTDLVSGTLGQDRFVVFMVGEPHMPNLVPAGATPGPLRKICFKVLGDEFWG